MLIPGSLYGSRVVLLTVIEIVYMHKCVRDQVLQMKLLA